MAATRKLERVRIFVDYSNFKERWRSVTEAYPHENFRWDAFPQVVLTHLSRLGHIGPDLEMRAVKIYASVSPVLQKAESVVGAQEHRKGKAEVEPEAFKRWLRDDLDQLPSYTVDISTRVNDPVECDCGTTNDHFVEQGVDTKIAIDLLALATRNAYDIGVLVTEDSDLVPSTRCVQRILDKRIVHLGFAPRSKLSQKERDRKSKREDLRAASWGCLVIDEMLPDLLIRKGRVPRLVGAPA